MHQQSVYYLTISYRKIKLKIIRVMPEVVVEKYFFKWIVCSCEWRSPFTWRQHVQYVFMSFVSLYRVAKQSSSGVAGCGTEDVEVV